MRVQETLAAHFADAAVFGSIFRGCGTSLAYFIVHGSPGFYSYLISPFLVSIPWL